MGRRCFLFSALACFFVIATGRGAVAAEVTVYVVRHADKHDGWLEAEGGNARAGREADLSQPLSAEGRRKAGALARGLGGKGVTAVFYTEYVRTYETAAPLLDALETAKKPAKETLYAQGDVETLARRVRRERGGVVLVVAHSHTILDVLRALGADEASVKKVDRDSFTTFVRMGVGPGGAESFELLDYPK